MQIKRNIPETGCLSSQRQSPHMQTEQHDLHLPASICDHSSLNIRCQQHFRQKLVFQLVAHVQQLLSVIRPQSTKDVIQDKSYSCIPTKIVHEFDGSEHLLGCMEAQNETL